MWIFLIPRYVVLWICRPVDGCVGFLYDLDLSGLPGSSGNGELLLRRVATKTTYVDSREEL